MIQTQTGRSNKRKREIQKKLLADIEAKINKEKKVKKMEENEERNMDMQGTPKMKIKIIRQI
jgi:5-carboxymethyl-2-hydroxymuconate isomerase